MAVPNPLPRLADGLASGKGSNITNGGGGFDLTMPEWMDGIGECLDEQVVRVDLTNDFDVTFAPTTFTSGVIEGGVLRSMAAVVAEQSFTIATDPTDEAVGTFFMARHDVTLNYAGGITGPKPYTGYFGPRAAFNYEGMVTYNNSTTLFGLGPMGFGNFIGMRNKASTALNLTPAWGFVHAPIYVADGATVTHNVNDAQDGPAAFYDDSLYVTTNDGVWDGSGVTVRGFVSNPFFLGNSNFATRVGYYVSDVNYYPTADDMGVDVIGPILGETMDPTNFTLDDNIGVDIVRLEAGTNNLGIRSYSPIELYGDTNTWDTAPSLSAVVSVKGTHTFSYADPFINVYEVLGTWTFDEAANDFGAFGGLRISPTLQNASAFSGTLFALNHLLLAAPHYNAVTSVIDMDVVRHYAAASVLSRSGGGTMTVDIMSDFYSTANLGAGTGIVARFGFHVADLTGSGECTQQVGLRVDPLSFAGNNIGIQNFSTSRLIGKTTIGEDADGTYLLSVRGGNSATNAFGLQSSTTGPTNPTSLTTLGFQHYVGSGGNHYLLTVYNDGGTTRYKYMPLTGTSTTWTHATTLPT